MKTSLNELKDFVINNNINWETSNDEEFLKKLYTFKTKEYMTSRDLSSLKNSIALEVFKEEVNNSNDLFLDEEYEDIEDEENEEESEELTINVSDDTIASLTNRHIETLRVSNGSSEVNELESAAIINELEVVSRRFSF